jgi:hypothetical protein
MSNPRLQTAIALVLASAVPGLAHGETVQLPYVAPDSPQAQWFVQQMGILQQQGNQPVFSQAGMLTINGQQPQRQTNTAEFDQQLKVLTMTFMPINGVRVSRSFKFEEGQPARVVDVFDNPLDREVTLNLSYLSNTNFGVNDSTSIVDPKKKEQTLGWAASTGAERSAMDLFGGKGAKLVPTVQFQPNNNVISATLQLKVPAKSKKVIVHWHGTFDSADSGVQWAAALKESRATADLPADVRRAIVNLAAAGGGLPEGMELLRGTASDVVELAGGDVLRGELNLPAFSLTTDYGPITVPAKNVAGLVTAAGRQWLVTNAGEIFAGKLDVPSVPITLAGGQAPSVAMSSISRLGYRSATSESPEWTLDGPMAFLASGERFRIKLPDGPIRFVTRYGDLSLPAEQVAAVLMPPGGVAHQLFLIDGSRVSGVLGGGDWKLSPLAMKEPATFATASLARVQFKKLAEPVGLGTATLGLLGDDVLAARLTQPLKLITAFDTLTLAGEQIRSLSRTQPGSSDVTVTTADGSVFRGRMAEPTLSVEIAGKTPLSLPAAALRDYDNPSPYPAASVIEKIKDAAKRLNSDDLKTRETAESELVAAGPNIAGVLQSMVNDQPPEARDVITRILKNIRKESPTGPSRLTPPPALE